MTTDANAIKGSPLFLTYSIGVETLWTRFRETAAKDKPAIAAKIDEQFALLTRDNTRQTDRWRAVQLIEQLMAEVLPAAQLLAEGERRLFEATALHVVSAENIGARRKAAVAATPPDIDGARAIYVTLLDDLHWFYSKRSLDRMMRFDIARPMLTRAAGTFLLCVAPFLALLVARYFGVDPWAKIPGEFRTGLTGGYTAVSFGMLGALFSRLLSFQSRYAQLDYDAAQNAFVGRMMNLRQIVGAVGALVLYFAVYGGLIGGNLFPNIGEILKSAAVNWMGQDLAKLIVWSFLAGFSERLVPDFLTRTEAAAAKAGVEN